MVKAGTAGRYRGEGGGRAVVIDNLLLNQRKIVREKNGLFTNYGRQN